MVIAIDVVRCASRVKQLNFEVYEMQILRGVSIIFLGFPVRLNSQGPFYLTRDPSPCARSSLMPTRSTFSFPRVFR